RRRCKGCRQAERAGVTPRIARTILRSADGDRPCRRRFDGMDTGYLLADLFVLPWADSRGARTAMPNRAPHTSIRRTEFMEYCRRANGLLCLDVGRPDHLAPLVGFIGDELPERGADVIDIGSTPKPASRVFMRGACRRSRPASEAG